MNDKTRRARVRGDEGAIRRKDGSFLYGLVVLLFGRWSRNGATYW